MPEYVVTVSPDRVVLRTFSRNSASALFRNLAKSVDRGEARLASATITLACDGRVTATHRAKAPACAAA